VQASALRIGLLLGQTAGEIRCVVNTAGAFVVRDLRIRAERAGSVHLTCCLMGSDDLRGGFALLDPMFDEADRVEGVGAFST
jgi:hypothetical protein